MREWLASLSGKLVVFATSLCGLVFVVYLWVASLWVDALLNNLSHVLAGQVQATRSLLAQTHATDRAQAAARSSSEIFVVERADTMLALPPIDPSRVRNVLAHLRAKMGDDYRISASRPEGRSKPGAFHFEFVIDGQKWRISHLVGPPVDAMITTVVVAALLTLLAGWVASALAVRWIARPAMSIQAQIDGLRGRLEKLQLPAAASKELRTVVHSFNGLVDEVQQADAKKLQMLAGLSHDLRTPLTRLRLRLETELEAQLVPRSAEALHDDLGAMQKIVTQFMAYVQGNSRAGLGVADRVEPHLRRLAVDYPDVVFALGVRGDASSLQLPGVALTRIATNLIDNAQAHGSEPIELVLTPAAALHELAAAAPGPREWALAVFDQGKGMTREQFERALQPFVRLDESSGGAGHCGLGLAIVDQLAQQLNGRLVWCDTRLSVTRRFGVAFVWTPS